MYGLGCVGVVHELSITALSSNLRFINDKNQGCDERWESMDGSSYHDEAGGDGVVAAVAQLPKFGPVVFLAEEPSIFFIIPVRQWGAALATPNRRREVSNYFTLFNEYLKMKL